MKKKLLLIVAIIFISAFSLQTISAKGNFMGRSYVSELVNDAKVLAKDVKGVSIEVDEKFKSDSKNRINQKPIAYELYLSISADIDGYFPDTGKYLSGLYIDDSGIYDIANGTFFDETNYLPEEPMERYIIEGTKEGDFALILTLSEQAPYFGDFTSPGVEPLNSDDTLGERYIQNVLAEIEDKNADVFVFEMNSENFPNQPEVGR